MRMSLREWILSISLILSFTALINIPPSQKLIIVFLPIIGLFLARFTKSSLSSLIVLVGSILVVFLIVINSFQSGVIINSLDKHSTLFDAGLRQGQIVTGINGKEVKSVEEFSKEITSLGFDNKTLKRIDIQTSKNEITAFMNSTPSILVGKISKTNLKTGLDISGGARALVAPKEQITDQQLQDLIAVSRERFNVFGLADVQIKGVEDAQNNRFMLVEVAGATPADLESLIAEQGKFEAKIGNKTVFVGGDKDITHVFRNDATQSAVYPAEKLSSGGYGSRFTFAIALSPEAAQRHADITKVIPLDTLSGGQYLTENLTLILDGQIVEALRISSGLRGQVTSQISVQGSGTGSTPEAALADARSSMNKLQTVLISGSLPFELEIVKLDTISPALGAQFNYAILLAGIIAIGAVSLIIFLRYKKIKLSLALLLISFSEILIILGIASLIRWNLDLPSIAGILATIGTGVDQQIIIMDESRLNVDRSLKERMKQAIFVVMSAYLTALVSLLPLFKAGAGLFKGFAITTLIGITAGVFITRPAFAELVKHIQE